MAVLCRALPEITVQFGWERVRDLRGLHGVVPLEKRRAYIPQLHGGKQCDPDGPAGQTRQPCERCQRQQVVDGPEQTENSLIKEAGNGSVASVTPLAVMTLLTANAVSTAQTAHSAQ